MAESIVLGRRARLGALWAGSALLIAVYLALPDGEDGVSIVADATVTEPVGEARKLEVVQVSPSEAPPGSAIIISYQGVSREAEPGLRVIAGKEDMEVLARRPGSIVARLPAGLHPGHFKLRVATGEERSKPYDLRIKAQNWRKPFRNLVGGFALLVFGIGVFARGVREAVGLRRAHTLALLARRTPAAFGFGTVVGALVQSTTASAGLLAGLVVSSLLAVGPAAAAFLGAQIGAASAPLLVTGLIDPHGGLVAVAIGVMWLGLASDRRATAMGRLLLGAGLIAFGLQTLRPGFEPFISNPALLPIMDKLRADGVVGVATAALLGAALVAAFQGPAPVVVLVLGLAQTTGHWDLRTALSVLSGSALGAALAALLTMPAGPRCRRLAQLHLILGIASTLCAAVSVDVWIGLSDALVSGAPYEIRWGKRVLMPNLGKHLSVAFAFSQVACASILLPFVPMLARWLERVWPEAAPSPLLKMGDAAGVVRAGLQRVLVSQRTSMDPLSELALNGTRSAGRIAEHALADAHAALEGLIAGPVSAMPDTSEGSLLGRAAFACLQLQRSLEGLLHQAERMTDGRVVAAVGADVPPLSRDDEAILREMHVLFTEGLTALSATLDTRQPLDMDQARVREIGMNGLEARARDALLAGERAPGAVRIHLAVLELVDAYEAAGNQVYRLAEALGETFRQGSLATAV